MPSDHPQSQLAAAGITRVFPFRGCETLACPGCGDRKITEEGLHSFRRRDGEATGRHVSFSDRRGGIEFDELEGDAAPLDGPMTRTQIVFRCQSCHQRHAMTFALATDATRVTFDPVA